MIKYHAVTCTKVEPAEIWCNMCGERHNAKDFEKTGQFAAIDKTYGFGSLKDGDRYLAHLCEPCTDKLFSVFKIPPQVAPMREWGEIPPEPTVLVSDPTG